jgi:hypothetical protein
MTKWPRISFIVTLMLLLSALVLTPNTAWAQDYQAALAVWNQQAAHGNAEAENSLGDCYANGWGVTKDPAEAVKWYSKAADQNDDDAQSNIAGMYESGAGLKQDLVQAYKWYSLAATSTEPNGPRALSIKRVAEEMTPEQIAEGKRLAFEWKTPSAPPSTLAGPLEGSQSCTPSVSDFQALALSPSRLTPEEFAALTLAQQQSVCNTRAFGKQVDLQKGVITKSRKYSPKYLSPDENDRVSGAVDDLIGRQFKRIRDS